MVTLSPSYLPSDGGTQAASAAPSVEENWVVQPSLTLLVLLLVPCVLLLFFLNCFLLFHRLPAFSLRKRATRRKAGQYPCVRVSHSGQARLEPPYMLSPGVVLREGRLGSDPISQGFEATLALEEGVCGRQNTPQSRGSCCQGGSTPSDQICCSPRPRCATPLPCCTPRRAWNAPAYVKKRLRPKVWKVREDELGSSCELDTRHNHVPPNTPAADNALGVTPKVKFCHTSSTQRKSHIGMVPFTLGGSELLEDPSVIPREDTAEHLDASSSLPGPGLDSDFGVSAGISLHILSSDSDSGSQSWTSGMEWDYYDPCYMRRNRLRRDTRHNRHLPMMCSKQYWI